MSFLVGVVGHAVAIDIDITHVAVSIAIQIGLVGVSDQITVVGVRVSESVAVNIADLWRSDRRRFCCGLGSGIRGHRGGGSLYCRIGRSEVDNIVSSVAVDVAVAGVAVAVAVQIGLVGVGHRVAVVRLRVGDAVAILITAAGDRCCDDLTGTGEWGLPHVFVDFTGDTAIGSGHVQTILMDTSVGPLTVGRNLEAVGIAAAVAGRDPDSIGCVESGLAERSA